jgi:hypothetical protein
MSAPSSALLLDMASMPSKLFAPSYAAAPSCSRVEQLPKCPLSHVRRWAGGTGWGETKSVSTNPTMGAPPTNQVSPAPEHSSAATQGLTVAAGASQVLDLSTTPILNLTGDLKNHGILYVISTNPLVSNVTLQAQNIFNSSSATITTVLPAAGLAGFSNAIHNLSLTLIAVQNIVNRGTIMSANNLTAMAGGTIKNLPVSILGATPAIMQATSNLNVAAANIVNHGLMSSLMATLNIANPSVYTATVQQTLNTNIAGALSQNINVDNTTGIMQALKESINIGGAELGADAVLSLTGGSIAAREINLNAGAGSLLSNLDSATGTVNVSAGSAQFGTDSSDLVLGNLCLTGDPVFYNNGPITIGGDISVGDSLAILSAGSITANSQVTVRTTDISGQAHNVYMVAGASLTAFGDAPTSPTVGPFGPGSGTGSPLTGSQTVTINGPGVGGLINLDGSTINVKSTGAGNMLGGSVTLVAYGGSGTGGTAT